MTRKTVDGYIAKNEAWSAELKKLREILLSTGVDESVKWGMPSYGAHGKNIVGLGAFKNHFCLWFHQGALLKDEKKILINAQEGKTKAIRQWRMLSAKDIKPSVIKRYVQEAIALAKEGRETAPDRNKPLTLPPKLKMALQANKTTHARFGALKPGLRREYADYIAEAKRPETKQRRIEKILPMIKSGVGLNDKYR